MQQAAKGDQDAEPGKEDPFADMEREAAGYHRSWKQTRELKYWTRYTDLRKRLAELRRGVKRRSYEPRSVSLQTPRWAMRGQAERRATRTFHHNHMMGTSSLTL